jgi:hypothetical protein
MNDLSKGKGHPLLSIFNWIWRRLFPKRGANHMFKLRRRRTKADGSSVETEITYRKDY